MFVSAPALESAEAASSIKSNGLFMLGAGRRVESSFRIPKRGEGPCEKGDDNNKSKISQQLNNLKSE